MKEILRTVLIELREVEGKGDWKCGRSAYRRTGLHQNVSSILYTINYFTWYHVGLTADINVRIGLHFRLFQTCLCYEGCECTEVKCECG